MSHTVLWCSRKNNNDVSWYWCRDLCPYQTAPVQHKPFKTGDHENWGRLPASKRAGYTQPKSLEFSKLAGLKARFYLSFLYGLPKGKQRYKAWFLFLTPNGRLHGQGWCFEVVTKLDLLKGYWQVPLTAHKCEISAFVTPDNFLQYSYMAFEMRNAPETFQRLMQEKTFRIVQLWS